MALKRMGIVDNYEVKTNIMNTCMSSFLFHLIDMALPDRAPEVTGFALSTDMVNWSYNSRDTGR